MKLTEREQRIYDAMLRRPADIWDIEALGRVAYGKGERPINWEGSMRASMRWMILKSKVIGLNPEVERSSGLGRGNRAEYRLKKTGGAGKKQFSLSRKSAML